MKKTITMNLSGMIFHIEEDAYEKLNRYLSTIRSYFNDSDGRDEIMNDIESRIAEMLSEKVNKNKQAVIMADVESVIEIMGKPEDFAPEGETAKSSQKTEQEYSYQRNKRRVFRDPDSKILGGVCSGIGNYFDFDPLWLRAAFAISFFVFGSGFLLYIILWIIIPEAKTTSEKLEMKGEKVDVNNIGKAVQDEFEHLKKKVKDFEKDVNSKETKDRIKTNAEKAGHFITDVFHNIFKVVGKVIAFILIFIAIALLVGLLATIFGKGTISFSGSAADSIRFSIYELSSAVLPSSVNSEMIVIALILFIGIPILSIIYGSIKHLFGIKGKNRIVKYTFNILWLAGLVLTLYIAFEMGNDFAEKTTTKQVLEIQQPAGNTLYLDVKQNEDEELDINRRHNRFNVGDWDLISREGNQFKIGYPTFTILPAESDSFQLVAVKSSHGFDKLEALGKAKNIDYMMSQKDSTILFNDFYTINATDKLRAQEVQLILKVPVNKEVFLSKRMEKIIFDIDNIHNTLDHDMVNRKWVMTKQGLKCVDCAGLELN